MGSAVVGGLALGLSTPRMYHGAYHREESTRMGSCYGGRMATACPHCGSDRPPVEDVSFRFACPACGGPRLPTGTVFRDEVTERAGTAALVRAGKAGRRANLLVRFMMAAAVLMTVSFGLGLLAGGGVHFISLVAMLLTWTSVIMTRRRAPAMRAARARQDLDEAYALSQGTTAQPKVRIAGDASAAPRTASVLAAAEADAHAEVAAKAEAEAEAEREDA
jgi:hypothetical protein